MSLAENAEGGGGVQIKWGNTAIATTIAAVTLLGSGLVGIINIARSQDRVSVKAEQATIKVQENQAELATVRREVNSVSSSISELKNDVSWIRAALERGDRYERGSYPSRQSYPPAAPASRASKGLN